MFLTIVANHYDGSERIIRTVNIENNIIEVCTQIQSQKPFIDFKTVLDLDLTDFNKLTKLAIAYFIENPPSVDQMRELRKAAVNNESLYLHVLDILERSK